MTCIIISTAFLLTAITVFVAANKSIGQHQEKLCEMTGSSDGAII